MKILFINKNDITGGAGITASRLNLGLKNKFQTDNYFIVGSKKSNNDNVFLSRKKGIESFIERGINYYTNIFGIQYKFFPFSSERIKKITRELKPDIISIHNILGGYFKTSLLVELSQIAPIVWTMHDMWAITSNAAHTFGDESFLQLKPGKNEKNNYPFVGVQWGSYLIKQKQKIYTNSNINIVCPSEWLIRYAKQSVLFNNKKIEHIFNGVDISIFLPKNKTTIRATYQIPIDAKVIIFSAEDIKNSEYKGGACLLSILEQMNFFAQSNIHLLVIGKGSLKKIEHLSRFTIHQIGYIFDEEKMADYLSMADVLLYPTKADNLPNVLVEAIACGTPAVTYDIGGCAEIIKNNFNGYVVKPFDFKATALKTLELLDNTETLNSFSLNARKYAEEKFSLDMMANKYFQLFNEVISQKNNNEKQQ